MDFKAAREIIYCPECSAIHIDQDKDIHPIDNGIVDYYRVVNFAKKPHSRHTCLFCGVTFDRDKKSIRV